MAANEDTEETTRYRNATKDEQQNRNSVTNRFDSINEILRRLGSGLLSSDALIRKVERDFFEYQNSVKKAEEKLVRVEQLLNRGGGGVGVLEEVSLVEKSTVSPSVVGTQTSIETELGNDVNDRLMSRDIPSSNSGLTHNWDAEDDADVQQRKSIKRRLQSSLHPSPQDLWCLWPVVFQCIWALGRVSHGRLVEGSCLLIQRVYRGYVVRKSIEMTYGRSFNVRRGVRRSDCSGHVISCDDSSPLEIPTNESSSDIGQLTSLGSDDHVAVNKDDVIHPEAINEVPTTIETERTKSKYWRKPSLTKLFQKQHPHHHQHSSSERHQQHRGSVSSSTSSSSSSSSSTSSSLANRRSWSVSGATEWDDPSDAIVTSIKDLDLLHNLLSSTISKQKEMSSTKATAPDIIFCETLDELSSSLTDRKSKVTQSKTSEVVIYSYKELMTNFERTLEEKMKQKLASTKEPFEGTIPLFVNAFRSILNEFIKKKANLSKEISEPKSKAENAKKNRKKESSSSTSSQSGDSAAAGTDDVGAYGAVSGQSKFLSAVNFCPSSSSAVPAFVVQLIEEIEQRGLSTEGIYRVGGNAVKIKQLINDIDNDVASVDYSVLNIHVMTSVLKSFLRNMKQPLITSDLSEHFVQLMQIEDFDERVGSLNEILGEMLLPLSRSLLDHLLLHLAKVSLRESLNRMSVGALAIVFAPCVMRLSDETAARSPDVKTQLQRQTDCLQFLIEWKRRTLKDEEQSVEAEESALTSTEDRAMATDISTAIDTAHGGNRDDVIHEENLDDSMVDSGVNDVSSTSSDTTTCHVNRDDVFAANGFVVADRTSSIMTEDDEERADHRHHHHHPERSSDPITTESVIKDICGDSMDDSIHEVSKIDSLDDGSVFPDEQRLETEEDKREPAEIENLDYEVIIPDDDDDDDGGDKDFETTTNADVTTMMEANEEDESDHQHPQHHLID